MEGKPKGLDALEDLIPQDMKDAQRGKGTERGKGTDHSEAQPDAPPLAMALDDPQVGAELTKAREQRRLGIRRLRGRDLNREIAALYKFASSSATEARIKCASKKKAQVMRTQLYFARAQERARVSDIQDTERFLHEAFKIKPLEEIRLSIEETDKGWYVVLGYRAEILLELGEDET
jgi:hypothetical protein